MKAKLVALIICLAGPTLAIDCADEYFEGNSYTKCSVDVRSSNIELYLYKLDGKPYGQFTTLERALMAQGKKLTFAMNAGMYHEQRDPVGYYVENGTKLKGLITSAGPGNFGLLPNGVFCVRDTSANVIETLTFQKNRPNCRHATQSGPMLVIDGALHPRFLKNGVSKYIRNGVGTSTDGYKAVFVISNNAVTFHDFGSYFRDALELDQALYFDGNISRLHARALKRSDFGFQQLGPIIAVVEDE